MTGQAEKAVMRKACREPIVAPLGKRQPVASHGASLHAAAARSIGTMSSTRLPSMIANVMM